MRHGIFPAGRGGRGKSAKLNKPATEIGIGRLLNSRYRKSLSSRLLLKFEPVLSRSFARRMRNRVKKNAYIHRNQGDNKLLRRTPIVKFHNKVTFPNFIPLVYFNPRHSICVVLHIYFSEQWDEFASYLCNLQDDYDLFVSLVHGASAHLTHTIHSFKPDAQIFVFPNHGRDVFPFIAFLNSGVLARYELVLKLHSKKTLQDPEAGRVYREALLEGLLGTPEKVRSIIVSFQHQKRLGLAGPKKRLIIGKRPEQHLNINAKAIGELERITGISVDYTTLAFVAGTMFWVRPQALKRLQGLLGADDFDLEPLPNDGAMPHAVERFFGAVVADAGFEIEAIEALPFCGKGSGVTRWRPPNVLTCRHEIFRPILVDPTRKFCLFASYSPDGTVWPHTISYCQRLRELGLCVALIVATEAEVSEFIDPGTQVCDALIVRDNAGFDFASWAMALKIEPRLWTCSSLLFANDSVYSASPNLPEIIERIEGIPADFVGLTDSIECGFGLSNHSSSYFRTRHFSIPRSKNFGTTFAFYRPSGR